MDELDYDEFWKWWDIKKIGSKKTYLIVGKTKIQSKNAIGFCISLPQKTILKLKPFLELFSAIKIIWKSLKKKVENKINYKKQLILTYFDVFYHYMQLYMIQ